MAVPAELSSRMVALLTTITWDTCSGHRSNIVALVRAQHGDVRRVKDLMGPRPHSNRDAELAGNMGAPDNGPKLRPHVAVPAPMAIS